MSYAKRTDKNQKDISRWMKQLGYECTSTTASNGTTLDLRVNKTGDLIEVKDGTKRLSEKLFTRNEIEIIESNSATYLIECFEDVELYCLNGRALLRSKTLERLQQSIKSIDDAGKRKETREKAKRKQIFG